MEGMWNAISAQRAEEAASHYTSDFVQFSLAPPLRSIGPNVRELSAWFETWRGPIGHESRNLAITISDDVAFCTSLDRMTGTKRDGVKVDLWYRVTLGLRKIDGRWMIAHQHESVPFYMDGSYKAAVDLAP
ncbi:MAG: YybH family protein [Candidatus Binatia bacterium]